MRCRAASGGCPSLRLAVLVVGEFRLFSRFGCFSCFGCLSRFGYFSRFGMSHSSTDAADLRIREREVAKREVEAARRDIQLNDRERQVAAKEARLQEASIKQAEERGRLGGFSTTLQEREANVLAREQACARWEGGLEQQRQALSALEARMRAQLVELDRREPLLTRSIEHLAGQLQGLVFGDSGGGFGSCSSVVAAPAHPPAAPARSSTGGCGSAVVAPAVVAPDVVAPADGSMGGKGGKDAGKGRRRPRPRAQKRGRAAGDAEGGAEGEAEGDVEDDPSHLGSWHESGGWLESGGCGGGSW